jgi:hypothetical protein
MDSEAALCLLEVYSGCTHQLTAGSAARRTHGSGLGRHRSARHRAVAALCWSHTHPVVSTSCSHTPSSLPQPTTQPWVCGASVQVGPVIHVTLHRPIAPPSCALCAPITLGSSSRCQATQSPGRGRACGRCAFHLRPVSSVAVPLLSAHGRVLATLWGTGEASGGGSWRAGGSARRRAVWRLRERHSPHATARSCLHSEHGLQPAPYPLPHGRCAAAVVARRSTVGACGRARLGGSHRRGSTPDREAVGPPGASVPHIPIGLCGRSTRREKLTTAIEACVVRHERLTSSVPWPHSQEGRERAELCRCVETQRVAASARPLDKRVGSTCGRCAPGRVVDASEREANADAMVHVGKRCENRSFQFFHTNSFG